MNRMTFAYSVLIIQLIFLVFVSNLPAADQETFWLSLVHPQTPDAYGAPFPIESADITGYVLLQEHKWKRDPHEAQKFWVSEKKELTSDNLIAVAIKTHKVPSELFDMPDIIRPVSNEVVTIDLSFNESGALKLKDITEKHIGKRLALVLDNDLIFVGIIHEPMTTGGMTLSGVFTEDEANKIAERIRIIIKHKKSIKAFNPDAE